MNTKQKLDKLDEQYRNIKEEDLKEEVKFEIDKGDLAEVDQAIKVADLKVDRSKVEIKTDADLREAHFGIWEGLSKLVDTSPVVIQDEKLFGKLSKAAYHFKYIKDGQEVKS